MIDADSLTAAGYTISKSVHGRRLFSKWFGGKAYCVHFEEWDWRAYDSVPQDWSYEPMSQFNQGPNTFNVTLLPNHDQTLNEIEAFFADTFERLGCDRYDRGR